MDGMVATVASTGLDQDPSHGIGTLISTYGPGSERAMGLGDVVPGSAGVHTRLSICGSEIICHGQLRVAVCVALLGGVDSHPFS